MCQCKIRSCSGLFELHDLRKTAAIRKVLQSANTTVAWRAASRRSKYCAGQYGGSKSGGGRYVINATLPSVVVILSRWESPKLELKFSCSQTNIDRIQKSVIWQSLFILCCSFLSTFDRAIDFPSTQTRRVSSIKLISVAD